MPFRIILFQRHDIWSMKCRCDFPNDDGNVAQRSWIVDSIHRRRVNSLEDVWRAYSTFKKTLSEVKRVRGKIKNDQVKLLVKKQYFGYKISDQSATFDKLRRDALRKYKKPKTPKQVKKFLGLAGYYRQFIQNFPVLLILLANEKRSQWNLFVMMNVIKHLVKL